MPSVAAILHGSRLPEEFLFAFARGCVRELDKGLRLQGPAAKFIDLIDDLVTDDSPLDNAFAALRSIEDMLYDFHLMSDDDRAIYLLGHLSKDILCRREKSLCYLTKSTYDLFLSTTEDVAMFTSWAMKSRNAAVHMYPAHILQEMIRDEFTEIEILLFNVCL